MSRFSWIRRFFSQTRLTIRHPALPKFQVAALEERLAPAWLGGSPVAAGDFDGDGLSDIVTGSQPGSFARVTVRSTATGNVLQSFLPFGPVFSGGASVAVTAPDASGSPQLLVGAGPGGGPHVRLISAEGIERKSFFAFAPSFTGGLSVASADFDQDGVADIVVGAGPGGGPHVRVLNGMTGSEILGFYAYSPDFTGGVTVAAGDLNGDGIPELITGAGVGGGPHVRVFNGQTGTVLESFFAYESSFRDGISVSTGDVDGDGVNDIVTSPGAGGGPHVRAFSSAGQPITAYMAFTPETRGGISVATGDLDGDGRADLVVGGISVRVLDARTGVEKLAFTPTSSDYAAIQVPGTSGEHVAVQLTQLDENTIFRNEFGLFPVDDAAGRINGLLPSDAGYAAAALADSRVKPFFQARTSIATEEIMLPAGSYFGFYLVQNASAMEWRATNLTNALGAAPLAFFSFAAANPDGYGHMLRPGRNRYAFEDQTNGGDQDFNDIAVSIEYPTLGGSPPLTPPVTPPVMPPVTPPVSPPLPPPVSPPPPVTPPVTPPTVPPLPQAGNFPADLAGYTRTDLGGTTGGVSVTNGIATLTEGDRFRVGLSLAFTVPASPTAVVVSFDAPSFDTSSTGLVKDAFEIAVLGEDGSLLALPTTTGRDAAFNWTEGFDPTGGAATTFTTSAAMVKLSALPAGTSAQLVMRLVNNDNDKQTTIRLHRVDFISATGTVPVGLSMNGLRAATGSVDLAPLTDVSPSIQPIYGRTTLTEENTVLTVDVGLKNVGSYPIVGNAVLVIGNLSDPNVGVINPDGFTSDGRPYLTLSSEMGVGLAPGNTTASRLLQFTNPNRERFTYDLQVMAGLDEAPTLGQFGDAEASVGVTFAVDSKVQDSAGQPLTFKLLAGPEGMTIDGNGRIQFTPQTADIGTHTVRVHVTDQLGATAEGGFILTVKAGQPNRPPIFTSTPPTDATVAAPFEVKTYTTGPNPVAVTAGNFGSGVSIVTADPSDQTLRIHAGSNFNETPVSVGELNPSLFDEHPLLRGAAVNLGFEPGTEFNSERDVYGVIADDVNRDGNPDIIASVVLKASAYDSATTGEGYLAVRLGNGDGTFRIGWQAKLPSVKVGGFVYTSGVDTVRHTDVTADGIKDLVTVQKYGGRILTYVGKGDGTFNDVPVVTESAAYVNNFQVADLNADGKPDLVRFEKNFSNRFRSGTSVMFGNGAGGFGGEVLLSALDRETEGYLVDLDGKNGPDIVRLDPVGQDINVRLNDGSGTFGPVVKSDFKGYFLSGNSPAFFNLNPESAQFGDFDGDGKLDMAGINGQQDYSIVVLRGNGDGTLGNNTIAGNLILSVPMIVAFARGSDGVAPDLNGDGVADLLLGDKSASAVYVSISDGKGNFTTETYTARMSSDVGFDITTNEADTPFVANADFNRDGVMDVVFVRERGNNAAGAIGLALGDRPGTLRLPRNIRTTIDSWESNDTKLADFTGDGFPDLLSSNRFNFTVSVNRGDGTFEAPRVALNTRPFDSHLVVADFDRDGKNDIGYMSQDQTSFVQAFGNGDGTFTKMPTVPYPDTLFPGLLGDFLQAGDFNADGHPDLAYRLRTGGAAGTSPERQVLVLIYDPTGRRFNLLPDVTGLLKDSAFYTLSSFPDEALGFADLNGDGTKELFTHALAVEANANRPAKPSRLTVWQLNGSPATDAATLFTRSVFDNPGFGNIDAENFVVGDFNRDGLPDLAIGANNGTISVGFGTGDFGYRDNVVYSAPGLSVLGSRDVNGDSNLDLIANLGSNRRNASLANGGVFLGRPDGSFGPIQEFSGIGSDQSLTFDNTLNVADMNADGRDDISINLITQFSGVITAAPQGLAAVARGDLNGDGKSDLVAVNTGFDRVKLLYGKGSNQFDRQTDLFSGLNPVEVALGDTNGDGKTDILTANRGGKSVTLLRNGGTSFSRSDTALEMRPDFLATGELTGDGLTDIVVVGESTLIVLPGNPGALTAAFTLPLGFNVSGLTLADVTGDGKLDAVLTDASGKRVMILPGQGNGTFSAPTIVPLAYRPDQIAAADLNADGKLDLIVTFPDEGRIGVLFGRGNSRFTTPQLVTVGKTPATLAVHDVNADGKPDLLVSNTGDGTLSVVLNRYDPSNVFRYQATATDPDGDIVTFSLEDGPGGMLLDEASGMAVWAPMPEQIGTNRVVLRASDDRGAFAEQGFSVRVTAPVAVVAPQFTSEPVDGVSADAVYRYQPRVTASTTEPLRYTLVDGPAGMTVNPTTGEVIWDGRRNGLSLGIFRPTLTPPRFVNRGEVTIPDSPSLRSASITAETWFRADVMPGPSSLVTLIAKRWIQDSNPNNIQSWAIEVRGNKFIAFTGNRSAVPDAIVTAPASFVANRWYHVAMTFDDATRQLTLYVDGQAVGSAVSAVPLAYSDRPLEISPTNIFAGTLSGIRVWDQARSASTILADMTREVPSQSSGLVLDLRFKEGPNAITVEDASPFNNSGTIVSSETRYEDPERIRTLANTGDYPVTLQVDNGRGGISEQRFTVRVTSPFAVNVTGRVTDETTGSPLAGRVVYVDSDGNGRLTPGEATTTTDTNGNYTFRLAGRSVCISLAPEAGRIPTTPSRIVDLSTNAMGIDFSSRAILDGPPVFVSTPPTNFNAPGSFQYRAFASSTDGSHLSYRLSLAPRGAVIDPTSGLVTWYPDVNESGFNEFILAATDGQGRVTLQQFTLNVTVNTSPVVTSVAPMKAMAGLKFRYDVAAQDAEESALIYDLETAPVGMTINNSTGRLEWTPTANDLGTHSFTIVVRDGVGGETRQPIALLVGLETANNAPTFTISPRLAAQVGAAYRSRLTATDADGDALQFTILDGPAGLTVSDKGELLWTRAEFGNTTFRVQVRDGRGGVAEESYMLNVGTFAPSSTLAITSSPPANAVLDVPYVHDLVAPGGVGFQLLDGPRGLSLDTLRGRIRWTPSLGQLGPVTVSVMALDDLGTTSTLTWTVTVRGSALAPAFASPPLSSVGVGETYVYPARANNQGGSPLLFTLVTGPTGLSIDGSTGDVTWTPNSAQLGTQAVILRVSDGVGNFSTQAYEIVVTAGSANKPPVANSTPPTDASIGQPLTYTFAATDPDGSALTYSIARGPRGMTIDATTGRLTWTPAEADLGAVFVTLVARDVGGAAAVQSFVIDVRTPNRAPSITNTPPASVPQGGMFRYDILALDPDREPLFYDLLSAPAGMTVDSLGRVRWQTSTSTSLRNQPITVRVRDGRGGEEIRNFNFDIVADTTAPRVAILIQPTLLYPYSLPARVRVTANDDVGVVGLRVMLDGVPVGLAADNSFKVPYSAPGNGRIQVFAIDAAGNEGVGTGRINMRTGLENDPNNAPGEPTAVLDVVEGATVGGFVRIRGTAISPDFERYTLSFRRQDQASFTTIATATVPVTNGELGVWDTTLFENDGYILRLEVRDIFGGVAFVERTVGVSGELKLGNFRLSFADMTIPVAGIPITVARTYDTLRADREGDFGYGWRMEFRNTDLRTSLPKSGLEDIGIYTPFRSGVRVFVTLPGGKREGFTFTPSIRVLPGFGGKGLTLATPSFTPDRGVRSTLSAGGGNLIVNEFGELYAAGGLPWTPSSPDFSGYTLTTEDNIRYSINGKGQLTTARDLNGNTLTFTDAGVTGPGGTSVSFERAASNRITAAIDPLGNAVRYAYSAAGDLVRVTDREGHTTTFGYRTDRQHYLETVTDPLGRTGARNEYGPDGRLNGLTDAAGTRVAVSYDPANRLETVVDDARRTVIQEYDERGNVVATTDPAGRVMRMEYDVAGNLTRRTDASGAVYQSGYDAQNRLTSQTNPLGHTTRYTYSPAGTLTAVVDALGNTTRYEVNDRGNVTAVTDALGNTTRFTVDARGNVTSKTDALGNVTRTQYDPSGRPFTTTDPLGRITTSQYDATGNTVRMESGGLVVTFRYDANGQQTSQTDPLGKASQFEYNAAGDPTVTIDPLGRRTTTGYDDSGRPTTTGLTDGTNLSVSYGTQGTIDTVTDRSGQVSGYRYDVSGRAIGRTAADATPGTAADNPLEQFEYDPLGRITGVVAADGTRSAMTYDLAGNQRTMTTVRGQQRLDYDPLGRVTAETDPDGGVTRYTYDAVGNLTTITDPAGRVTRLEYDAVGRMVAETDPLGQTTRAAYDAVGNVTAVTDPSGRVTQYGYDQWNRRTSATDPAGNVVRYEYDAVGRLAGIVRADGSRLGYEFDAGGRLIRETFASGRSVRYEYDGLNQLLARRYDDGRTETFEYNTRGQRIAMTSINGTTRYTYTPTGQLAERIEPDGRFVRYGYEAGGQIVSLTTPSGTTTYGYNAADLLTSVTAAGATTRHEYDAAGRLTRIEQPNGTVEVLAYDAEGRLIRQTITNSAGAVIDGFEYVRDAGGRVTTERRADGRKTTYTYDTGGRLIGEDITLSGGVTQTLRYTYDAAGNRLTREDSLTGTTTYGYNAADQLLTSTHSGVTTTYTYDAEGRQTAASRAPNDRTSYHWDAAGRLVRVEVVTPGGTRVEENVYNADGLRVAVIVDGVETRLLSDTNRAFAQVISETNAAGVETASVVYGQGTATRRTAMGVEYRIVDQRGSTRATTDASGAVVDRADFDGFGRGGRDGFTGEPRSAVTGLDYLRARFRDPNTGRFLSPDQLDGQITDVNTRNDYVYADNDPVNRTDPSGLASFLTEQLTALSLNQILVVGLTGQIVFTLGSLIHGATTWEGPTTNVTLPGKVVFGTARFARSSVNGRVQDAGVAILGTGVSDDISLSQVGKKIKNRVKAFNLQRSFQSNPGGRGGRISYSQQKQLVDLDKENNLIDPRGSSFTDLAEGLGLEVSLGSSTVYSPSIYGRSPMLLTGLHLNLGLAVSLKTGAVGAALGIGGGAGGFSQGGGVAAYGLTIGYTFNDQSVSFAAQSGTSGIEVRLGYSVVLGISISWPVGDERPG